MNSKQRFWSGMTALIALIAGTLGVPFVLIAVGGSPIPSSVPQLGHVHNVLSSQLSDGQILGGLTVLCWIVWLAFTISVLTELFGWLRGVQTPNVPLTGGLARRLVIATAVLFAASTQRPVTPLSQQLSPITIAATDSRATVPLDLASSTETSTQSSSMISYTVVPRDDLWTLAQEHLGDPYRWRELFQLNKGVLQGDGETLRSPELLRPGWVLQFPADATGINNPTMTPAPFNGPTTVNEEEPPPGPNVTYTTTPPSTTSTVPAAEAHHASSHEDAEFPYVAGFGLMSAGALVALDQLRRRRRRHRTSGEVESAPSEAQAAAEIVLRLAAESSKAERLNVAARALAHVASGGAVPEAVRIQAVRVSNTAIEFLFDTPVPAPESLFQGTAGGRTWTLDTSVHEIRVGALAAEIAAPLPTLIHVGIIDGADVLIDLEAFGVTAINDTPLFHAVLLQLATSTWSDHVNVLTVGPLMPESLERVRHATSVSEALEAARLTSHMFSAESTKASTFRMRTSQEPHDGWIPTVIAVDNAATNSVEFDELCDVAKGGRGVAVLVQGTCEQADRRITSDDSLVRIDPPDVEIQALPLKSDTVEAVIELLDEAPHAPAVQYTVQDEVIDLRESDAGDQHVGVQVNVLGDIEVIGGAELIDRSRSIEAVVFLALHRNGATDDKLKAALWPERLPTIGTFNTTISLARRQLGKGSDGTPYVPPVKNGRYTVSPLVVSDLDRLESCVAAARSAAADAAIQHYAEALQLVRGRPFDNVRSGYAWAHVEGFVARAEAIVADAAHELAQLHLDRRDGKAATWAARQGLLASPGYEVLYRDLMLACSVDDNLSALETIMAELNTLLDAVDPSDSLDNETTRLYNDLRRRRSNLASR